MNEMVRNEKSGKFNYCLLISFFFMKFDLSIETFQKSLQLRKDKDEGKVLAMQCVLDYHPLIALK